MVLGLKAKSRRGPSVQVEYVIQVQDIKPWPPTQSLKTVRSVLIQWENGDRNSGSTSAVTPSITDGKIEFNESFRLPLVLSRDKSIKNGDVDVFYKNLLELNLYEPRRDKTVKGQLLGTAIVDLADYGIINEGTNVTVPMNCTRSFRNTSQPILYLRIQPYDKSRSSSTLRGKLEKESSIDNNGEDSVSALMTEEYADEAEVASLTDDDVSSHSSLTASSAFESNGASPSQNKENGAERGKYSTWLGGKNQDDEKTNIPVENESKVNLMNDSSCAIAVEGSSGLVSDASELDLESNSENAFSSSIKLSKSFHDHENGQQIHEDTNAKENSENETQTTLNDEHEKKSRIIREKSLSEISAAADIDDVETDDGDKYESSRRFSPDDVPKEILSGTDLSLGRDKPRHVKSVRSPMDNARGNGSAGVGFKNLSKQEAKVYPAERGSTSPYTKSQELEQRIKMLEGELIEAAGVELALYSVVAEHGSSINKVHAPARRLSRLYFQALEGMRGASTTRSVVSGLIVVAKACGNDVPRLTFWLSNCVVLRTIVSEAFGEDQSPISTGPRKVQNGTKKGTHKKLSALKWRVSSSGHIGNGSALGKSYEELEDPQAFLFALEKVEFWIFSRIVESVWWQALTPHMQSSAAKVINNILDSGGKRNYRRTPSSCDQEQVNLSLEIWKNAFKDACEKLCPLRAGGHECGCLRVLAKLIMEQCVARLDVAMFNAILRESADEIPTDPVSDPISDARVLPIPAGKSSFGAGAQLKNVIGNWSRWLTDLFGMDDDDAPENEGNDEDGENQNQDSSFKSFFLLKSLSDLMMLPKDMLLSNSIRREVCPAFGSQLIKRILENFVPDEFCPDPIPVAVFEALDSKNTLAEEENSIMILPCKAPAVAYSAPPASSSTVRLSRSVGTKDQVQLRRSASVLRRSNTSDDELDELDSPLSSILGDSLQASPVEMRSDRNLVQSHGNGVMRYQLLRHVWANDVEI